MQWNKKSNIYLLIMSMHRNGLDVFSFGHKGFLFFYFSSFSQE